MFQHLKLHKALKNMKDLLVTLMLKLLSRYDQFWTVVVENAIIWMEQYCTGVDPDYNYTYFRYAGIFSE